MNAPAPPAAIAATRPHAAVYVKLTLVALFWGGTFIAGRILAATMSATSAATGRFAIAALMLVVLTWKIEGGLPKLSGRQVVTTFGLGATGIFLYNVCFFAALARMPAGRTALFVALNPVATAVLLSIVVRGERLSLSRWAGIAVALFGALVVISRGEWLRVLTDLGNTFGAGERFMLCAVLSWAAYTVIGRRALDGLSPLAATTYAALWGLALLVVAHLFGSPAGSGTPLTWQAVASMLYLGAIGTVVAFVWYSQGIRELGPARAAVFTNLVPVFGVLLSVALLGEPLSPSMLGGGALVIAGVALTNRAKR
ncbi:MULTISPECIES: DMT family transporter [Burkholderia]|uniref:DMT family transporter n=1 Tax=Burkholderia TaxID=32008 RepID=UPI00064E5B96|nr:MULTISPECIES: DMT family transporter [Burkholderia]KMK98891.1 membrane protein [Burkholderia cepacia]KML41697.1 membrane protein [Burkholderia lata]KMN63271.1 membrane protein [Burkholderia sp. LK4]UQO36055.1 DMT family transporter [Burkholderia cepacia]UQO50382.1 DMT family transporter [Burkholderia cepacia]